MTIEYRTATGVAYIVLNRPDRRNAFDPPSYVGLHEAITRFGEDRHSAVAVISAEGDHFTVGGDMEVYASKSIEEWRSSEPDSPSISLQAALWDCPKPLVVAIQGYCTGFGMMILLASDIRVAAEDARIGFTTLKYFGGAASGGFVERLLTQTSYVHAMEMLLTGRVLGAEDALRYGIVSEVVPREGLAQSAEEWAQRLLETPPAVLSTVRRAARRLQDGLIGTQFEATETDGLAFLQSPDFREVMEAWRDRRPPRWSEN